MLCDHCVEHLRQGFLAGLGQAGDGVELLLDPGGGTALAGEPDGGLAYQNLVERQVQNLGEAWKHRSADADAPDLVMGERLLRDAELVGELLLGQSALLACLGDTLSPRSEEHTSALQSLMRISY